MRDITKGSLMRDITTGSLMHVYGSFAEHVDYTARLTVRLADAVDALLLREALDKTQRRYPYLSVQMRKNDSVYYYDDNPRPVVLLHTDSRVSLNAEETNYHVWAVCYNEDRIHLDFYHGITDGAGIYRMLATLLWYYCSARYGLTDHTGIRTLEDLKDVSDLLSEETDDPMDHLTPPAQRRYRDIPLDAAFTFETDGGLTPSAPVLWDIEIPEEPFIRFTSANDASPGTMVSLLFARAADRLYPDRTKDIVSAYVINARPMTGAAETYHNCLSMAVFKYEDRIRSMPLERQCTIYRGKTFIQSDEDRIREILSVNAGLLRGAAESAESLEAKKQVFGPAFSGGEGLVTFLVSYVGKWPFPALGQYIREMWPHSPNTFSILVQIAAAGGKIFLSVQQRFREDTVLRAFLKELESNGISYKICRHMASDTARFPEP